MMQAPCREPADVDVEGRSTSGCAAPSWRAGSCRRSARTGAACPSSGASRPGAARGASWVRDDERDVVEVAPAPVFPGLGGADDRVSGAAAWAEAWRFGELSQHAMWPQDWHMRRCSQVPPIARQSVQPAISAGNSRSRCCRCASRSRSSGQCLQQGRRVVAAAVHDAVDERVGVPRIAGHQPLSTSVRPVPARRRRSACPGRTVRRRVRARRHGAGSSSSSAFWRWKSSSCMSQKRSWSAAASAAAAAARACGMDLCEREVPEGKAKTPWASCRSIRSIARNACRE